MELLKKIPRKERTLLALFVFVGVLVFGWSIGNPFVYDDLPQIVRNPFVHKVSDTPALFLSGSHSAGAQSFSILGYFYKPIFYSTYALLFALFGENAYAFHLFQLLIHAINAYLVCRILRRFFEPGISVILSLAFLVHPINTEVVLYAANLQDALFLCFGLAALSTLINGRRSTLSVPRGVVTVTLLLLSVLSKETGALFFVVTMLYAMFFFTDKASKARFGGFLLCSALLYLVLRIFGSTNRLFVSIPSTVQDASFLERMQSVPEILLYYFSRVFVPIRFAIGQEWIVEHFTIRDVVLPATFVASFFAVLLLGLRVLRKAGSKHHAPYLFFLLWFIAGLLLHMQLIPLDMTVADRWFSFPFVGLLGMAGAYVSEKTANETADQKRRLATVAIVILAVLSALSVLRTSQWRTAEGLYEHDLRIAKTSPQLELLLGEQQMISGRYERAKEHLQRSVDLNPKLGTNLQFLGAWHEINGNPSAAKERYAQDIQLANDLPKDYSLGGLIGIILYTEKNPGMATRLATFALRDYPYDERLLFLHAASAHRDGQHDAAVQSATRLYTLYPSEKNGELKGWIVQKAAEAKATMPR